MARKMKSSLETEKEIFPQKLCELMNREPKTTQPQLAAALGVQRQTVSNYCNGQSSPDWKTLSKIADFFGVSADWLLDRTEVESPDANVQAVSSYTGLSEDVIRILNIKPEYGKLLGTLAQSDKGWVYSPLLRFFSALEQVEEEAVKAAAFSLSNDSDKYFVDASMKRDALELALFRFSEVCRRIPDKFQVHDIIDLLDDQGRKLYKKELLQYLADHKQEADNGEH